MTETAVPRPRRSGAMPMRLALRQLHLYLGVFFAPCILFFALSGAVQVLGLHEASKGGGGYKPAPVVEKLSEVHIHQRYAAKRKPSPPASAAAAPRPAAAPAPPPKPPALSTTLTKWFFVATASGLAISALLGIWMAVTQSRRRGLAWALLIAGALAPVLLLTL